MKPERFAQLKQIVLRAADLPPEERQAYLDQVCGDDTELRHKAEAVLADGAESSVVMRKVGRVPESVGKSKRKTSPIPTEIAGYRIIRKLGEGGMGVVFEVLQEKPKRTVALKVMKAGVASTSALRRFEYESQLLARLQHPGIAQVYEVGTHDDGSGAIPYFAMEYVPNALPITEYAEKKKLGTRERMQLFAQVCDAVHHGHQKGIIHRDLKPGNILVNPQGQVKVIDFGVARSTDSDLALTTLQSDVGQLIGTLQYMSPEQCEADPHDIDTRSDVYALGVVQYELLCGQLPYDVRKKAFHEVTRVIREEQPTRPSTISRHLRGDVETIALKALEKERERRYQSAVELAQDIRRYLAGEAIVGRPPSIVYQLRIFARRHKALFGALTAIFVVLAVGLVVSSGMYLRAEQERDRALAAEQEAEKRRGEAEAAIKFLSDTLASVDPAEVQGREITIEGMLDKAAKDIDTAFADLPLVEATLRATIGRTYYALGKYPTAELHLETAFKLRKRELGDEHLDTLTSMSDLASIYRRQGRLDEAEPLLVRALDLSRRVLGEEHPQTISTMVTIGNLYFSQDLLDKAEFISNQTLELSRRVLGEEHPDTLSSMHMLAVVVDNQGRYEESEPLFLRALELYKRDLGEKHPATLGVMNNLGEHYRRQGRYDEAEPLLVRTLELCRSVLGEETWLTLNVMKDLAVVYYLQGRLEEAELLGVRTLELRRKVLGEGHTDTMIIRRGLADFYHEQGRYNEAEPLYASNVAWVRESSKRHWGLGTYLFLLGRCLANMKRYEEAEAALLEAKNAILEAILDAEHKGMTNRIKGNRALEKLTIEALIELYVAWGMPDKANQWRAKLPEPETETSSQQTESTSE